MTNHIYVATVRLAHALLIGLAITSAVPAAYADADNAQDIVARAKAQAHHEKKNVFVYFHASWCPWCRQLDKLLDDPTYGPKFRASYVIAAVDIRERGEREKDENPGWDTLMASLRGAAEQDVPYYVILSPMGKKLGDSYRGTSASIPDNAGYPQTEQEITGFLELLKKTAPAFKPGDIKKLGNFFRAHSNPQPH